MSQNTDSLRRYLEQTHRELDERLTLLVERGHLSPNEQVALRVLKKKKLATKDRMLELSSCGGVAYSATPPRLSSSA